MTQALAPLVRQKNVLLTTYRRDGTPVGTPVHVAVDDGRAYFRTWQTAWKARRLRNNPEVEVVPSPFRGKPTGTELRGRARLLAGGEAAGAARALRREYPVLHGVLVPLAHRLRGYTTVHYELTLLAPAGRRDAHHRG